MKRQAPGRANVSADHLSDEGFKTQNAKSSCDSTAKRKPSDHLKETPAALCSLQPEFSGRDTEAPR